MRDIEYTLGIDIGSTTVKIALLDEEGQLLFSDYERHFANIQETLARLIKEAMKQVGACMVLPVITGSGGLTLAQHLHVPFVQEVIAVATALGRLAPQTDVAIELGGEDAKIIYFEDGNVEQRMNGICAGGTGSFIDQMASLLKTDASGLNEYAKGYEELYPIAARCGVFAKSDIQPLINDGATHEDLAASIFQAVVNQTISGLACGKPIRGHVAFLGGPLHFLDELRLAFVRTLKLDKEHTILLDNSHLFAAIGSAMNAHNVRVLSAEEVYKEKPVSLDDMARRLEDSIEIEFEVERMEPLFSDSRQYELFCERQKRYKVKTADITGYEGNCFLGIDAGSTTTKAALISEDGSLLYSFYSNNNADPLAVTKKAISEIRDILPKKSRIAFSCSTGYGEALIKAALMLDDGEVETVAHYKAAAFFDPEVDCILDIGGQDMKCIKIRDGAVDSVLLNEACSSGCGSFIETFANSLNYSVQDFATEALFARHPIDLGTRCTVFMNSKVKQAQKEGASVADISAGLAYSVIKNALYKVIKVSDASELGEHIVVQGGTFYNDAVLKAFEKTADCDAIRPDIAGIMGAFGAALIARERYSDGYKSTMLPLDDIVEMKYSTAMANCGRCTNNCRLTVNKFGNGRKYISGNRCERGLGGERSDRDVTNLFDYKYKKIFGYESLSDENATRGVVGIPRVLNIYENYPFWHVFFTELGYRVVLSPASTRKIYEKGIESIPSESECYPAKLAHGHVMWLLEEGIKFIFYPCIPYERREFKESVNHYNCPIVTSYAENIKNNVEELSAPDIKFCNPFLSFADEKILEKRLTDEFPDIPPSEVKCAVAKAWRELADIRADIASKGREAIRKLNETGGHGIVLAGRPYHIDPEINHGIPELITSYGFAVFTEDSVSELCSLERPLRVNDQWMYHTRLYAAANYVKQNDNLDLIQLNSFGCGLDAVTTDQVYEILSRSGKIYTCLKIDEVNNLGAARIRVRSLIAAIREQKKNGSGRTIRPSSIEKPVFTENMKCDYTIICPQMSPIHFSFIEAAFRASGYNLEVLPSDNKNAVNTGLKYVNNDACYPSLIVVGQIMEALLSGKYDPDKTAIIMSQTGGGCRASNYIAFIRRALEKAGMSKIPVISANLSGLEANPGFKITLPMLKRGIFAAVFGDILMKCVYRMRPYEVNKGSVDELHKVWEKRCIELIYGNLSYFKFKKVCRKMIKDFDRIPITDEVKPRVGIVGEILVKFLPAANNHLADLLEKEGAEPVVPDLIDFVSYCFYNQNFKADYLGFNRKLALMGNFGVRAIDVLRSAASKEFARSRHFVSSARISELAAMASPIVSGGNQTGEGWFLTGEMMELINGGVNNIVCTQPFGCLPNHIVGKGVIKAIRKNHPCANIVAIDYDPGASEVNQLNRIKLMLSTAVKNLK